MEKRIYSRILYVYRGSRRFATTDLTTLSEHSGISYWRLRKAFREDDEYRDKDCEIFSIDADEIYTGKPRGSGFS